MWFEKQLLKEYELETMLTREGDDMEKKAIYLGRTLEWGENGLGVRPGRHVVAAPGNRCEEVSVISSVEGTLSRGTRETRFGKCANSVRKGKIFMSTLNRRLNWLFQETV